MNLEVSNRAKLSGGISCNAVYDTVASELLHLNTNGGTLLDVGCGRGELRRIFIRPVLEVCGC